jgi:hypothetical protein
MNWADVMSRLGRKWRRRYRRVLAGVGRMVARLGPRGSPWDRVRLFVPVYAFGPGSRRQFADYLRGESHVHIASIDAIVEWLHGCRYMTDIELFNERDWWQHPSSFEQLRCGDCEDFALWAWRKLVDMGIEAEFYVGRVRWEDEAGGARQHAWVVYRLSGEEFLFEAAAASRTRMIRPLSEARADYTPHFAIDQSLRTFAFGGYLIDDKRGRGGGSVALRVPDAMASDPVRSPGRGSIVARRIM